MIEYIKIMRERLDCLLHVPDEGTQTEHRRLVVESLEALEDDVDHSIVDNGHHSRAH